MAKRNPASRGVRSSSGKRIPAPKLPYKPRDPKRYRPSIALVGCGGITKDHLTAYRKAGYRVVALCDVVLNRAKRRQRAGTTASGFPETRR